MTLCHKEEPGIPKAHHSACVSARLEPVSVSLEKCARAIVHPIDRICSDGYRPDEYPEKAAERIAKAVLDAAGVPYAD